MSTRPKLLPEFDGKMRPAWCDAHWDFAWLYYDGSGSCFYACIVEMGSSECRLTPLKALQRAKR